MRKASILAFALATAAVSLSAETVVEPKLKGEGAATWGIDLDTMATGIENSFVSEIRVDLVRKGVKESVGTTNVKGYIKLEDFQWSIVQNATTTAGWDSAVDPPSGLTPPIENGGFTFKAPTVTARIVTDFGPIPAWVELAAGRAGRFGDVWTLNYARFDRAADTWDGGDEGLAEAIAAYHDKWDVQLNLGNDRSVALQNKGWSTGGINVGLILPGADGPLLETVFHISSRGSWKEQSISKYVSGAAADETVAPNTDQAYALGLEAILTPSEYFELKLGAGGAMVLGTGQAQSFGASLKPTLWLDGPLAGVELYAAADLVAPSMDFGQASLDAGLGARLNLSDFEKVDGVNLRSYAEIVGYYRKGFATAATRATGLDTLNAKLNLVELAGDRGLLPGLGLAASAGLYDILGTNTQSPMWDDFVAKKAIPTWDCAITADYAVAGAFAPYLQTRFGTALKNYNTTTYDNLKSYYGSSIPASLVGAADSYGKVFLASGIKIMKVIDLVTIDLRYENAELLGLNGGTSLLFLKDGLSKGVVTLETRVRY
jgi:hypothetical protein